MTDNTITVSSWEWLIGGGGLLALTLAIGNLYRKHSVQNETLFRRLDEVKNKTDETYTKKEVCAIVHTQVKEKLDDLKKDVECLPKIKSGLDLLLRKYNLSVPD